MLRKLQISINKNKVYTMHKSHFHKSYEIYFLTKGNRKYFIDDGIYKMIKGDIILVSPNVLHKSVSVDNFPHTRILINFDAGILNQDLVNKLLRCFEVKHIRIPKNRISYIQELFLKIQNEYNKDDVFSEELVENYLTEILIFLTRIAEDIENVNIPSDISESIQSATIFIKNNFNKDISLNDAAKEANMSRTYFSAKFKECTGFGFSEFLNSVRLINAEKLLMTTNLSITDVAMKSGFNNSNYFTVIFKKTKGITPMAYKKSHFV